MNLRTLMSMLFMIVMIPASFAGKDKKDTYQVYVNAANESIRTSVLSEPSKEKADMDRIYYWYSSNKIIATTGGYEGKLLHGEYVSFYLDNNLKEKGKFKKGLKHGKWISWYSNGKIKDITEWDNGKRNGDYRSFDELGRPVLEAHFSNDLLTGKMMSYENGKQLSIKRYRKGKEIVPKPVKEKKPKIPADSTKQMMTKEGINTVTPSKEDKPSLGKKLRAVFSKGAKKNKQEKQIKEQTKEARVEDNTASKKEKTDIDQKPMEKKKKDRKKKNTSQTGK